MEELELFVRNNLTQYYLSDAGTEDFNKAYVGMNELQGENNQEMNIKKWIGLGLFGVLTKIIIVGIFGFTFF